MEKREVRQWYGETYPKDDMVEAIGEGITFKQVIDCIDERRDFYELIGERVDSVIRERIFEKIAEIQGVEYGIIYAKWLET